MKVAVKHNISDFKDYLKSNDIFMEENIDENDGSVHFAVGLETEAGAKFNLSSLLTAKTLLWTYTALMSLMYLIQHQQMIFYMSSMN